MQDKKIDIVIPLATGSDGTELKYALRSLDKHLSGIGNLFIIGDVPSFLRHIFKYSFIDKWPLIDKEKNIYEKLLYACTRPDISDHFLFTNDDIYLQQDFKAIDFPYYYSGILTGPYNSRPDSDPYKIAVNNTAKVLKERGHEEKYFDIHAPIVYHKDIFLSIMEQYDWSVKRGYTIKSLYCNTLKIPGVEMEDFKIHTPKIKPAIKNRIRGAKMFASNEHSLNAEMVEVLESLYPEKSRWEIPGRITCISDQTVPV